MFPAAPDGRDSCLRADFLAVNSVDTELFSVRMTASAALIVVIVVNLVELKETELRNDGP